MFGRFMGFQITQAFRTWTGDHHSRFIFDYGCQGIELVIIVPLVILLVPLFLYGYVFRKLVGKLK